MCVCVCVCVCVVCVCVSEKEKNFRGADDDTEISFLSLFIQVCHLCFDRKL